MSAARAAAGRARRRRPRDFDARLADAAELIAEDYLRFLRHDAGDPEAVKAFAARQAAGKAALAHLEALRHLAGDPEGATARVGEVRQLLLQQAREATAADPTPHE